MRYRSRSRRKGRPTLVVAAAFLAMLVVSVAPAQAAAFTVANLNDSGAASFRQAVLDANATPGADTITFAAGLTGTITLDSPGDLVVIGDLTIQGPGAGVLTVDPGESGRALVISDGGTARVSGLTFSGGTGLGLTSLPPIPGVGLTHGGAILTGGNLTVTECVFSGNTAGTGGAIAVLGAGDLTVERTLFSGNTASTTGSAIYADNGARIFDSTFVDNAGSAALVNDEVMNVIRSTFARNLGGIFSTKSLIVSNSTFVGNTASGAIRSTSPFAPSISSSTFVGNSFGIQADGPVTLRNSILVDNFSNCSGFGAITDGGGNFYWPFSLCPGTLVDPLLDPDGLADNGGPTMTVALTPESPAVDAVVFPCFGTDQRGVVRPQGAACDSGAFELEQASSPDELIQGVLDDVAGLAGGADPKVADKAEDARDKLETALAELAKTPPDGAAALGALEGAAGELEAMSESGLLADEGLLDDVAEAARLIASDAIEAAATGGDPAELTEANQALLDGDALRDDGRVKDAIGKYKDAYSKAASA